MSCYSCEESFLDNKMLFKHMACCHSRNKTFTCDNCKKTFSSLLVFKKHTKTTHLLKSNDVIETSKIQAENENLESSDFD